MKKQTEITFKFRGLEYKFDAKTNMISGGKFIFPFHINHAEKELKGFVKSLKINK